MSFITFLLSCVNFTFSPEIIWCSFSCCYCFYSSKEFHSSDKCVNFVLVAMTLINFAMLYCFTSHQLKSNSVKCLFIYTRLIRVANPRSDMLTLTNANFFIGFNFNIVNSSSQQVELTLRSINFSSSKWKGIFLDRNSDSTGNESCVS
jgi:hypothetical protein